MPEGPSIVILREEAAKFAGKVVRAVAGNSKQDLQRMQGKRVRAIRSWGKHFLVAFPGFAMRVHFMLFGSYRIDEAKPTGLAPRVSLAFDNGELNFYACSLKYIEGDLDDVYDWSGDVMADAWDPNAARRKLRAHPDTLAADALLDQDVFAGVGNIIKNEVLHRIRVHPESTIGALPPRKLGELIKQARDVQFRLPRMEEGLRAEEALPGAYEDDLPARRQAPGVPQAPGPRAAPRLLLRGLPETLSAGRVITIV